MRFYVGVTDSNWYEHIRNRGPYLEVNFWIPGTTTFKRLKSGEPFLFKLHSPNDYIVGEGTFKAFERISVAAAWKRFGEGNGFKSDNDFQMAIHSMRDRWHHPDDVLLGCVVLAGVFFLARELWIPAYDYGWKPQIVQGKSYDTTSPQGAALWAKVQSTLRQGKGSSA